MSNFLCTSTELTISELCSAIRQELKKQFSCVRVRGEISGYRGPHSSGHAYFSLKDSSDKIDAIVWRRVLGYLQYQPKDGLEASVTGYVSTFNSRYQLIIDKLEPVGTGALMAILEARKQKLYQEGIFSTERKLGLPFLPKTIGVITSESGAVLRDIMHRLSDRCPVHVLVWPVAVQGETSSNEITNAIRGFNNLPLENSDTHKQKIPKPDVLIIARGGGSLEDLWSFNEENVVRAADSSTIPIISAIGHETDWTLLDLVADLRAPTPSGAAEMAVPVHEELFDKLKVSNARLRTGVRRSLTQSRIELQSVTRALTRYKNLFGNFHQRLDMTSTRLTQNMVAIRSRHAQALFHVDSRLSSSSIIRIINAFKKQNVIISSRMYQAISVWLRRYREERISRFEIRLRNHSPISVIKERSEHISALCKKMDTRLHDFINQKRINLEHNSGLLESLSHIRVLERGFTLVQTCDGRTVKSSSSVVIGEKLTLNFRDGRIAATVTDTEFYLPK